MKHHEKHVIFGDNIDYHFFQHGSLSLYGMFEKVTHSIVTVHNIFRE